MITLCPICQSPNVFSKAENLFKCNECGNEWEPKVYAVDFDGYLCESEWPEIGQPRTAVIEHFKRLRAEGNKLILWTCREGEALARAVIWCADRGLHFDAFNANLPERIALYGTDPRKIGADYYCDDKNYVMEVHK